MVSSTPRAAVRLFVYLALTFPLMPVQALLLALKANFSRRLPTIYHRLVCRVFAIDLDVHGAVSTVRPTLFICNHVSYLDIEALGAVIEGSFVAKREVSGWPLFGWLAKLQRTVFVERRATAVANERDGLAQRLAAGDNIILFAEGTSGDGNRVRPFKSALFSAAEQTVNGQPLTVQPVSVAYTRLDGMPIGRQWRPFFAWYGAMDLAPHLWHLLGLGRMTVTLMFHPTTSLAEAGSRKALALSCQQVIARGLEAANSGRIVHSVASQARAAE